VNIPFISFLTGPFNNDFLCLFLNDLDSHALIRVVDLCSLQTCPQPQHQIILAVIALPRVVTSISSMFLPRCFILGVKLLKNNIRSDSLVITGLERIKPIKDMDVGVVSFDVSRLCDVQIMRQDY